MSTKKKPSKPRSHKKPPASHPKAPRHLSNALRAYLMRTAIPHIEELIGIAERAHASRKAEAELNALPGTPPEPEDGVERFLHVMETDPAFCEAHDELFNLSLAIKGGRAVSARLRGICGID